jgi:hypothetical protein
MTDNSINMVRWFLFIFFFTANFSQDYSLGKGLSKTKQKASVYETEFAQGSQINIDSYTPQMLTNLEVLCKVWGFLKYYHPSVAAGKHNWDAELFRIMPSVLDAKNDVVRNKILLQWTNKLEKVSVTRKRMDTANVKLYPDLAWIEDVESLGIPLSQRLIAIKDGKRNSSNYYFPKKHTFQNELVYPDMRFDDDGFRLLTLFRYWNMIQYSFPYRHLTDKNWNTVLGEFIPQFLDADNEHNFKLTLMHLVAQICDSHAACVYPDFIYKKYKLPYTITFIDGQAVVSKYFNEKIPFSWDLKIGDIIIRIDTCTVEKLIEEKTPYISASTHRMLLRDSGIEYTDKNTVSVQVVRQGDTITTDVNCLHSTSFFPQKKEACRLLSPNIGYLYPASFETATLAQIKNLFADTKGIVIDLRCYPSFAAWDLEQYLLPESTSYAKWALADDTYPGLFRFMPSKNPIDKNEHFYRGKVVIIVNEYTQSMAETMVMALQVAPRATVIGSQTAGTNGGTVSIRLPGNITAKITASGAHYPDGRETQRVGVTIDEEVNPTIRGIIEEKDELLERAIEIIENE